MRSLGKKLIHGCFYTTLLFYNINFFSAGPENFRTDDDERWRWDFGEPWPFCGWPGMGGTEEAGGRGQGQNRDEKEADVGGREPDQRHEKGQ